MEMYQSEICAVLRTKGKLLKMEIMTLYSQYIFSLILFAVKNKHLFTSNNEIHTYKTRNYLNFLLPTVNLTKFYKWTLHIGY